MAFFVASCRPALALVPERRLLQLPDVAMLRSTAQPTKTSVSCLFLGLVDAQNLSNYELLSPALNHLQWFVVLNFCFFSNLNISQ